MHFRKVKNLFFLLILTFSGVENCFSQERFIPTKLPVKDIVVSDLKKEAWYTSGNKIYKVDLKDFAVIDSVQLSKDPNQNLTGIRFSDPDENILEIESLYGDQYRFIFQEYPADTTFYYNISLNKRVTQIPGNGLMTSIKPGSAFVFGWNEYNKLVQENQEIFYSMAGELSSNNNGETSTSKTTGILRFIEITPDKEHVLLLYYDTFDEGKNKYRLELRSFPGLEILKTTSFESYYLDEVYFSENSGYAGFQFTRLPGFKEDYFHLFFSIPELNPLSSLPKDFKYRNKIQDGTIWTMEGGSVVLRDGLDGDKQKEIWPNLTPMGSITGFENIDSEHLLIYGESSLITGLPGAGQGLYEYSLTDNALYSDVSPSTLELQLFDPYEMKLQDNRFVLSGDYKVSAVNANGNKMLVTSGNKVQLWNSKTQKKLEEWLLDNVSRNYLSKDGNRVLFFEENKGKTFDEFLVGVVDLSTGKAKQRKYTELNDFSPLDASCECYEQSESIWICAGGNLETGIWRIDISSLEIEKLRDFSDSQYDYTSIINFRQIPGTPDFLFHLVKENFNSEEGLVTSPGIFSLGDNSFRTLDFTESISSYFPVSAEQMIYQSGNKIFVREFKSEKSTELYKTDGYDLVELVALSDNNYAVFKPKGSSEDFLIKPAETSGFSTPYSLPSNSRYFLSGADGIINLSSERIHTYYPSFEVNIPWDKEESIYLDNTSLSVDNSGRVLLDKNWLIDLNNLELKVLNDVKRPSELLHDGRLLVVNEERYNTDKPYFTFQILDSKNNSEVEWESEKFSMDYYTPEHFVTSPDGKYVACFFNMRYRDEKTLFLINTLDGTVLRKQLENTVLDAIFSPTGDFLYVSQFSPSFEKANWIILRPQDMQLVKGSLPFNPVAVITNEKFLTKEFTKEVSFQSLRDGTVTNEKSFYSRSFLTETGYSGANKLVYAGSREGELILWEEHLSSPVKQFDLGSSEVISIKEEGSKLFVLLKEGKLGIIDLVTQELLVNLTVIRDEDKKPTLAWLTPEGYFKAGKNDIRNFHFVKEGDAFPLVNYEIFLNRPDFIMQRLGYAAPEVIKIYKDAYEKRLTRNNINPDKKLALENSFSIALADVGDIPTVTAERLLQLEVLAPGEVKKINAYINGVPVYSAPAKKQQTLDLVLNSGVNEISIVGLNNENSESNPLSFSVTTTFKNEPKIYYFGVGVSTYEDSGMNLQYADKDVKKMAATFGLKYGDRVNIDTLLNTSVTKENLQLFKEKLKQTNVDDIVILSFSGHGLVDESNNFYFATHDVDFDKPQERGFSYNEIHNLLNEIPARKKLLLIDACNSGEIDSLEDLEVVAVNENITQHIPEGAKGSKVVKSKNKRGLQDSFEVMKSLFYDLDRGNGAYIIAAAGGREFAYESDEWDNGVFTYSFLNALYELGYEWSGAEKPIPISSLKQYVEKQVLDLTNGKQQPTARSENIEWDWELK